ncbi:MAG: mRNA surveillance protein pelota [Candidatus Bathyarchaeia archaeon]
MAVKLHSRGRAVKLLSFNSKRGEVEVVLENQDDLWHLYNIVDKGDLAYAKTTREIKGTAEGSRPSAGRRVSLLLGIRVEEVFFDRNVDRLRIRGIVVEGPECYGGLLNSYHTLSLKVGSRLRLVKEAWHNHQLRRLKEATEVKACPVIILAIDDEDACVSVLGRFGVDVRFESRVRLPSKLEPEKRGGELVRYFSEVAQALSQIHANLRAPVAVVGPGYIKNEFTNYLRTNYPAVAKDVTCVCSVGSAGSAGVGEALRSGILTKVIEQCRVLQEMDLVESLLARLADGNKKVAYGLEDVSAAANYGAVETLLVVDRYLRELPDEERRRLEDLMRGVEHMRGRVVVLSSRHEGGEKILSLGGVAAILRFTVN